MLSANKEDRNTVMDRKLSGILGGVLKVLQWVSQKTRSKPDNESGKSGCRTITITASYDSIQRKCMDE